jgi:hypothetical protein
VNLGTPAPLAPLRDGVVAEVVRPVPLLRDLLRVLLVVGSVGAIVRRTRQRAPVPLRHLGWADLARRGPPATA